ncbi:MAG: S8 family serine peptidase, partial [Acidobacteriota bacterium]|nr:S8 family serine peptidase [Acidobacteriota bacterium]
SIATKRETDFLEDIIEDLICNQDEEDDDGDDDDGDEADVEDGCLAGQKGVVVIAAAGNSGMSIREYPAAEDIAGLLAVAASTEADTLAAFSTYGRWVSAAAPGEGLLSSVPLDSVPPGAQPYGVWSGTSMAAPLAAGTAALVRARFPDMQAANVVTRINNTSKTISGPVQRRIDAARAVGYAQR